MSDDQPETDKPYGKGHRPAILLLDGPLGGKVFEIPEHRQTADGLPQPEYWFGCVMSMQDPQTGEEHTEDMVLKYELHRELQGYIHTETREAGEAVPAIFLH